VRTGLRCTPSAGAGHRTACPVVSLVFIFGVLYSAFKRTAYGNLQIRAPHDMHARRLAPVGAHDKPLRCGTYKVERKARDQCQAVVAARSQDLHVTRMHDIGRYHPVAVDLLQCGQGNDIICAVWSGDSGRMCLCDPQSPRCRSATGMPFPGYAQSPGGGRRRRPLPPRQRTRPDAESRVWPWAHRQREACAARATSMNQDRRDIAPQTVEQ